MPDEIRTLRGTREFITCFDNLLVDTNHQVIEDPPSRIIFWSNIPPFRMAYKMAKYDERAQRLRITQDNSRQKLLRWLAALWGCISRNECHQEKNEARTYEILQVLREGKEHYIRPNFHIICGAVTTIPPMTVPELRAQIVETCSSLIIMAGNPSRRPSTGGSSGKNA